MSIPPEDTTVVAGGRYEITGLIATGGMGSVYRARDTVLGRTVALKVLAPGVADPDFVARFRSEATNAARMSHPAIVQVYDFGDEDASPYIAMEFVDGQTLREILTARRVLRPEQAAHIALQVAGALEHARRAGVVHRDVKPENILVTVDGHVKVADFGLSRALAESRVTRAGTLLGTAHYVAPEQVSGREADHRSDVYSLGVVLFEMLTGRAAFSGDSPAVVAYKRVGEDVPSPAAINPSVPPELDEVVRRATARDPAARYQTAGEMAEDLRRASPRAGDSAAGIAVRHTESIPLTNQDTLVMKPERPRAPRPRRARRWLIVAVTLTVLAAALGIVAPLTRVAVPDVSGFSQQEAARTLRAAGLREDVTLRNDPSVGEGRVITQRPRSGARVRRGETVSLIVSLGPELVSLPDVRGMVFDDAVAAMSARGFDDIAHVDAFDATVRAGKVVGQDPGAGLPVEKGTRVTLTVSKGPEMVRVPNVAGETEQRARDELTTAGFRVRVTDEASMSVAKGSVISQSPNAGASARKGSTVTLTISSGPPPVTVPDLRCMTRRQSEDALAHAGLKGTFSGKGKRVVDQAPAPGETLPRGSTMTVYLGFGSFC